MPHSSQYFFSIACCAAVNSKNAEGIAKYNAREEIIAKLAANQKALNGWLDLQYDASYMHYKNNYCMVIKTDMAGWRDLYIIYRPKTLPVSL